jgi:hypothetical protein
MIEIGQMFHFKRFFPIYSCKNYFPSCGPSQPLGTIVCTTLKLHYVRKLSCNLSFFASVVLEKKTFQRPHPIFAFLLLSPLGREPGPYSFTKG